MVEAGAIAVGGRDGFNGGAARGGEAVGDVELLGDGGDGKLAERVVDFIYTYGGEADWCGDCPGLGEPNGIREEEEIMKVKQWQGEGKTKRRRKFESKREGQKGGKRTFVSKDGGGGVPEVRVDELTGYDLVAVESLPVGHVGVRLASIGGGIIPAIHQQRSASSGWSERQTSHLESASLWRALRVSQAL